MARYQWIFDRFGYKPVGQAIAAVVIGGLMGLGLCGKLPNENPLLLAAGGSIVGMLAGSLLLASEFTKRTAKKRWAESVIYLIALAAILAAFYFCAKRFVDRF